MHSIHHSKEFSSMSMIKYIYFTTDTPQSRNSVLKKCIKFVVVKGSVKWEKRGLNKIANVVEWFRTMAIDNLVPFEHAVFVKNFSLSAHTAKLTGDTGTSHYRALPSGAPNHLEWMGSELTKDLRNLKCLIIRAKNLVRICLLTQGSSFCQYIDPAKK